MWCKQSQCDIGMTYKHIYTVPLVLLLKACNKTSTPVFFGFLETFKNKQKFKQNSTKKDKNDPNQTHVLTNSHEKRKTCNWLSSSRNEIKVEDERNEYKP